MNRILKAVIASTAVAATVIVPVAGAYAGDRHFRGRHHHVHRHHHHHGPVVVHRHHDGGAAIAAGILGLAAGAIIAGAVTAPPPEPYRPVRPSPDRGYFPEAPGQTAGIAEPWSPEWYRYCSQRFRSFDPQTGTYMGYDGRRHFCVAS